MVPSFLICYLQIILCYLARHHYKKLSIFRIFCNFIRTLMDKRSILKSPLLSPTVILTWQLGKILLNFSILKKWLHTRNILVFPPLLGTPNMRYSLLPKTKFRYEIKDGMNKDYWMGKKKFLLKVVVQAIFTYLISCFKCPDSLLMDIQSMINNFWWVMEIRLNQFTGLIGISFALEKKMGKWVLGNLKLLILHCYLSKHSVLLHCLLAFFIRHTRLNIFPVVIFFRLEKDLGLYSLGSSYVRSDGKLIRGDLSESGKKYHDLLCYQKIWQMIV